MAASGLRERKKQQTREHIAATARRLFAERGFDRVTVAEIARTADVAEKTVFNYFATKEDLVYSRMESFEAEMLEAIRARPEGAGVLAALRDFLLAPRGVFAERDAGERAAMVEQLRDFMRLVSDSPALVAREQQVIERYTDALAELIAEESGAAADDPTAWVAANALMGVHRALLDLVREQILAGTPADRVARAYRRQLARAFALLEDGLGGI